MTSMFAVQCLHLAGFWFAYTRAPVTEVIAGFWPPCFDSQSEAAVNRSLPTVTHCFMSPESALMCAGSECLVEAVALADSSTSFSSVTLTDSAFLTHLCFKFLRVIFCVIHYGRYLGEFPHQTLERAWFPSPTLDHFMFPSADLRKLGESFL